MSVVLVGLLLFAADPMIQFDISGGGTSPAREEYTPDGEQIRRDATQGAAYLGAAFEARRNRWAESGLFFGAGVEGTIDGGEGPYQWSVGFGPRVGRVWRSGRMDPFPEGYVYLRATPFVGMRRIADEGYLHDDDRRISQAGAGIRFGIGFTVPAWSKTVMEGMGSINAPNMHFNDPTEALACLAIGAAIVLFNHVELTYETYHELGMTTDHRIGIRFGTGF